VLAIHKILVPIPLGETGDATPRHLFCQAAWLARRFQAELILLHVVTPFSYPYGMLESGHELTARDLHAHVIQRAQSDLDRMPLPEFDGIAVTRVLLRGDPAREIVEAACNRNVDLIAMSANDYGAFYQFLLGSVTAKVLHEAHCPIWTGVHLEEPPAESFSIRRILCSVELTPHSRHTVSLAAEMATAVGATLTLVHVTVGVEDYGPGGLHVNPEWKEQVVGFATKEIGKLQQDMGTNFDIIIDSGNVPEALNRAAAQTKADVLIIGRIPGRSHLGDNGEGYGIIRRSRIPVLSV
jgi:nucleotide-binding universal stress UspA family protein